MKYKAGNFDIQQDSEDHLRINYKGAEVEFRKGADPNMIYVYCWHAGTEKELPDGGSYTDVLLGLTTEGS